jgi:hypothetical protein
VRSAQPVRTEDGIADYRIIANGQVVQASEQVYHQVGELPWRLTVGISLRIPDRSYRGAHAEWRQQTKELVVSLAPLGEIPPPASPTR